MDKLYEMGQKLDFHAENGIWLDYKDHRWIIFLKDDVWQKEEIRNVLRNEVTFTFVQCGIVDAFLLEIFDVLETSDIPFMIREAEADAKDSLYDAEPYAVDVVLLDQSETVMAERLFMLEAKNCALLREKLKERMNQDYDADAFDQAYEKLTAKYEPFELEPFTVFAETHKKGR